MTVSVTHAYTATGTNDPTKEVSSTRWNEAHTITGLATVAETGAYSDLSGKPTLGALAAKDTAAVADISATGTPGNTTFLRGDGTWSVPSGSGDMLKATYDPTNIGASPFARGNHTGSQLASTISDFSTAADARVSAAIGSTVQAYNAKLAAFSGLTGAANKGLYFTGTSSMATFDLTAAGLALLDDADAAAQRATLGLTIGTNVQAYDAELAAIAGLTSAADNGIQFTGAGTAATYDLTAAGKALLDDADATAQRATLGLTIGTHVQAYDAELAAIAGLTSAADRLPYFTGSGTAALATFTAAGRALVDDADAAAQLVTLGAIGNSLLTTRGDIITRGASAPQRLALGTSGYFLKSDGTDAVWAAAGSAGWTTISGPTSLSGSAVDITSIPSTYTDILLVYTGGVSHNDASNREIDLQFSMDNGSNWETAIPIAAVAAASVVFRGATLLVGYSKDAGLIISGKTTSTTDTSGTDALTRGAQHAGGINALRLSVLTAGSFDGGTITLFGR